MKVKICMTNSPFRDLLEEVKFAGENGFNGFEIVFEYPFSTPEQILTKKKQLLDTFSTYNLERLAHTPTFVDICNFYDGLREASVQETIKAINAARELEVRILTVHPGFRFPLLPKEKAYQNTVQSLSKLLEKAEEYDMILGIENLPSGFFPSSDHFTRVKEFEDLFNQLASDRLSFILDISHAYLRGSDPPQEFINRLYNRVAHIHVSDNLGERDDHLPLGAGRTNYKAPLEELAKKGYNKTITLEVFSIDRDYLILSKDKVKKIFEK
ncbi:MAG: sugar phosphate isomerase/epimerase family protein [Candidatus Jordarchaeaceae archaeon]